MTNSRSPCLTSAPSLNGARSMKPLTRACTSTVSFASSRPGYSSHSFTSRTIGRLTVTAGGGGDAGAARRRQPGSNDRITKATAQRAHGTFPVVLNVTHYRPGAFGMRTSEMKRAPDAVRPGLALIVQLSTARNQAAAVFFFGAWMCGLTRSTIASNAAGSLIASSLSILRFSSMPAGGEGRDEAAVADAALLQRRVEARDPQACGSAASSGDGRGRRRRRPCG